MAASKQRNTPQPKQTREGITRITVGGFKSISQEKSIEIRPLTILAGANSSGKSSIMQPLLLLKQTLEAPQQLQGYLEQDRGFLAIHITHGSEEDEEYFLALITQMPGEVTVRNSLRQIIHLPGLRGSPERTYPVTAVGSEFPGSFEIYVASVIRQWQTEGNSGKLRSVNRDLARLGLTSKVVARAIDDTQVELRVNRLFRNSHARAEDMVSVADVGLGISQTLPVVVALHVANQGQLIYLEQPEIHLHPRAQVAMAEVLADAAIQGKRMVVETHSSLLLRGIQTLVAEGKLPPELVKLHWFTLQEDGSTEITSADLDETGAFGDWPEDFDTVALDAESCYLDAAQAR